LIQNGDKVHPLSPLRLRRQRAPSLTGARSPRLRRRRGASLTAPLPCFVLCRCVPVRLHHSIGDGVGGAGNPLVSTCFDSQVLNARLGTISTPGNCRKASISGRRPS
jgi:hypothetical protein